MLVNEAVDAVHLRVASAADVDLAMTKGVNYPSGLLAWGDTVGASGVLRRLERLQAEYGEDRYRPSPLLRRCVREGRSLLSTTDMTTEAFILDGVRSAVGNIGGSSPRCARTISRRTSSPRSSRAIRRSIRRAIADVDPRLRQPGGRGQSQRGAHGRAARRPARRRAGRNGESALRLGHERRRRMRRAPSSSARENLRRGRRREHDTRAVRAVASRASRSRATSSCSTRASAGGSSIRHARRYGIDSMGQTAENVAEQYGVSRDRPGRFAFGRSRRPRRRASRPLRDRDHAGRHSAAEGRRRSAFDARRVHSSRYDGRGARQAQPAFRADGKGRSRRATRRGSTTGLRHCSSCRVGRARDRR